jgi:hypothetical protein
MREIMLLSAIVTVLGMAWLPAEARDRGFGFRHFSGQVGQKLHLRHPGRKFHHGGLLGKPRSSRHFGQGSLVLKFGDGDFVLRFGHMPHFKRHHFGRRNHHQGLFFRFDQPRRLRPWNDRGFAFEDRHGLHGHRKSVRGSQGSQGGGLPGGAPPEALLEQLEEMGFRYVPELLRGRHP